MRNYNIYKILRCFEKHCQIAGWVLPLLIILLMYPSSIVVATETMTPEPSQKYGFSTYLNLNFNSSDLSQLYSIGDSSSQFAYGNNIGMSFGLYYEIPFRRNLSLQLKALYSIDNTSISKDINSILTVNGTDVPSVIRHTVSANLSNVVLEPLLKFEFLKRTSLLIGVNAGIRLQKGFTHNEEILSPNNAYFPDGTQNRQVTNENPPLNINLFSQLCTGLSYDIPLNYDGTMLLSTDLVFAFGFVQAAKDFTLDVNSVKLGFNLLFSTSPTIIPDTINEYHNYPMIDTVKLEETFVSEPTYQAGFERTVTDTSYDRYIRNIITHTFRTDTIYLPKPVVKPVIKTVDTSLTISVAGIEDGVEYPPVIRLEEFKSFNTQPLLRYIFFDNNSETIPERYKLLTEAEAQKINPSDFEKGTALVVYYNLLNIIGSRMNIEKKAKLTLTGCNSNTEDEENNTDLSMKRAQSVAAYLENVWNIEKNRITINARNLPANYSVGSDSDCIAENRRVEITSDTWDVIAPIIKNDFYVKVTPPLARFNIKSEIKNIVTEWKLNINSDNSKVKVLSDSGEIPKTIDWNISNDLSTIPDNAGNLDCHAEAMSDSGNQVKSNVKKILLKRVSLKDKKSSNENDKEIDIYNLILFDYDKQSLNPENMQVVKYINSNLKNNSVVRVEGYTDRVGDENYNLELSKGRAKGVAKNLKASSVTDEGFGKSSLLYDNSLPEGRFYCRTVRVIVETPNK
jgi:outer membrane protein OmpA-like peptidoglycan-associated protein